VLSSELYSHQTQQRPSFTLHSILTLPSEPSYFFNLSESLRFCFFNFVNHFLPVAFFSSTSCRSVSTVIAAAKKQPATYPGPWALINHSFISLFLRKIVWRQLFHIQTLQPHFPNLPPKDPKSSLLGASTAGNSKTSCGSKATFAVRLANRAGIESNSGLIL
jgi:hypothetical protein